MPSPFPGMDPYLENPGLRPDVHHGLISEIQAALNRALRPKYHVRVEERVYISDESDPGRSVIVPDIRIAARAGGEDTEFDRGSTGRCEVAEPMVLTTMIEEEIHEAYLEIIDRELRQIITVIEVLSPANKLAGSRGRASFEQKRKQVMNSPSHWVEIDLLREGLRLSTREGTPICEYLVHVSEVSRRGQGLVWPIRLAQRLPVVAIPLRPDDKPASLDLQSVLNSTYDRAAYDLALDYESDAIPPLPSKWAEWSHQLLVSKGLRRL